jgi:hypothetical protein
MRQLTIAVLLLVAVGLQSALRSVWQPFGYVDLTLIMTGRPALLGAGGFSKTLTAYAVYFVASRVMLDTPILRIPVLASAILIDNAVYVGMHRLLGQSPPMPFIQSLSYKLIATTVAGTILLYGYESFFSTKARQRRQFTIRRRVVRGSSSGLRRRSR